jgi:hypothetical protein
MQRHCAGRQPVEHVEFDAGLPLRRQRFSIALPVTAVHNGLYLCPQRGVVQDFRRVHEGCVVTDGEVAAKPSALAAELHLGIQPVPEEALGPARHSHGDSDADQLGMIESQLDDNQRAHGKADNEDGRFADSPYQGGAVLGKIFN